MFLWAVGNIVNKVPFVATPSSTLKEIEKAFSLKDDSVVYDLGSGDGRVLFHLARNNPKAKYIGIENSKFPFILSKFGKFLNRKNSGNVKIINNNFFKQDLSSATHIFMYIYPNVMDDLLTKFDDELKPGTKLVSLSFKFTNKKPISEVDLRKNKNKFGRKLYIYEF